MPYDSADALTLAVAESINDRLDGQVGTRRLVDEWLDVAFHKSPMERVWMLLDELEEEARDEFEMPACDRCHTTYDEARGDGYCGLCPKCADETEDSAVTPGT